MTDIKGLISEVGRIDDEIDRLKEAAKKLNAQKRKLNEKKKKLEKIIIKYLENNDQIGVKYQGTAVIAKSKHKRNRRKKKEKEHLGSEVLRKYGIRDSDKVVKELLEAMKGDVEDETILQISRY